MKCSCIFSLILMGCLCCGADSSLSNGATNVGQPMYLARRADAPPHRAQSPTSSGSKRNQPPSPRQERKGHSSPSSPSSQRTASTITDSGLKRGSTVLGTTAGQKMTLGDTASSQPRRPVQSGSEQGEARGKRRKLNPESNQASSEQGAVGNKRKKLSPVSGRAKLEQGSGEKRRKLNPKADLPSNLGPSPGLSRRIQTSQSTSNLLRMIQERVSAPGASRPVQSQSTSNLLRMIQERIAPPGASRAPLRTGHVPSMSSTSNIASGAVGGASSMQQPSLHSLLPASSSSSRSNLKLPDMSTIFSAAYQQARNTGPPDTLPRLARNPQRTKFPPPSLPTIPEGSREGLSSAESLDASQQTVSALS